MGVKILTDSTCDLPKDLARELGITIVPLRVLFGEESFLDGEEITSEEFFTKMAQAEKLPTTAQVNPSQFIEEFTKMIDQGDEVIGIFIAAALSGTYNSSLIARDTIGRGKIELIDSHTASFGLGLLVIEAARMAQKGKSFEEIAARLETARDKVNFYAILDTLENLVKGGRLTATMAANLLGVKPIVSVADSTVSMVGKARGQKKAFAWVIEDLKNKGIDLEGRTVALAHGVNKESLMDFQEVLFKEYKIGEVIIFELGAVIGTHLGAGCVGLGVIM
ncbi:degV family protein [Syntrophobotulus glycolicus DSM 8271]|uniref:DegV family protein n=1 Tax=Syntrophobotulus glycolicus (strain DSM 8271 / FlGlyR) TaxID=645991 RepID=F0SX95_SYNGF|nr:DegV family protein [Syntrophobotulus glycolicus]ADY56955.1 degV family protein [Syntrophobotulus glycolicus DSM 8271]